MALDDIIMYISLFHGSIVIIGLALFTFIVYAYNDLKGEDQANVSGNLAIVEMVVASVSVALGVVISYFNNLKYNAMALLWAALAVSQFVVFYIRAAATGLTTRLGLTESTGCEDSSFVGCPVARIESAGYENICKFNAFDLDNINTGEGSSTLIDWSDTTMYDNINKAVLVNAANSAGLDIDAAALAPIHGCYYFGCPCTGDRETLNSIYLFTGAASIAIYLALCILSFQASSSARKPRSFSSSDADDIKGTVTSSELTTGFKSVKRKLLL
jgi:hypothetical protein